MTNLFEDQKTTLQDFTARLEKLGINYMLTGSMAMINYAMMRMTADIDVVIDIYPRDAEKFIREFETDFYVAPNRVRDSIARRFMFNLLHLKTLVKIDCVVRKETEFQRQAFARRERVKFTDDIELWIISREDLILSKLFWAKESKSEMQLRDVASIIRNGYDENYVKEWADKLDVKELLAEAAVKLEENAD